MARAIRIVDIVNIGDAIEVSYAAGTPPLQDGQDGSFTFSNKRDIESQIAEFEASLSPYQLMMMHLAIDWLKADGTFKNRNQVIGRTMTLDLYAQNILKTTAP